MDAQLCPPEHWASEKERCRKAKAPEEEMVLRTKPEIALEMAGQAVGLGLRFGWADFDAAYKGRLSGSRGRSTGWG